MLPNFRAQQLGFQPATQDHECLKKLNGIVPRNISVFREAYANGIGTLMQLNKEFYEYWNSAENHE